MTFQALQSLRPRRSWLKALHWLRATIRASELTLAAVAAAVGVGSGLATAGISAAARLLQRTLYGIDPDQRLSAIPALPMWSLPWLPLGGLLLGLVTIGWSRVRAGAVVDPVEANALRGGRMSGRDSLFVGLQSLISNGFGASVGLEAAYAQLGGAVASLTGAALNLRRADLRNFVGAGAGAGIAAAFGAPIAGAFYAFEIVIGSYTAANIAPVAAAALAGALVGRALGANGMGMDLRVMVSLHTAHYALFALFGVVAAFVGIGVMRLVGVAETLVRRLPAPSWLKPVIGGGILAGLAILDPETLSAGHGAMHADFAAQLTATALIGLFAAKTLASVTALGFGFRGGLFFASLYLGALLGRLFVVLLSLAGLHLGIDPLAGALVGMGALAVAIIGGPFTMTFLVLETTGDFGIAAVTLTASIVAGLVVRETFGYSFSTWRLHLRGETIRSAHDVGWMRNLIAARMMRSDFATCQAGTDMSVFRDAFPLGSTRRVVLVDEEGRYEGMVAVSAAHAVEDGAGPIGRLAVREDASLTEEMSIKDIMSAFDAAELDELAVLDGRLRPIGLVSEAYATRRYAEELERARQDLTGVA